MLNLLVSDGFCYRFISLCVSCVCVYPALGIVCATPTDQVGYTHATETNLTAGAFDVSFASGCAAGYAGVPAAMACVGSNVSCYGGRTDVGSNHGVTTGSKILHFIHPIYES